MLERFMKRKVLKLSGNDTPEVGKKSLVMHFPRVRIMLPQNSFHMSYEITTITLIFYYTYDIIFYVK